MLLLSGFRSELECNRVARHYKQTNWVEVVIVDIRNYQDRI